MPEQRKSKIFFQETTSPAKRSKKSTEKDTKTVEVDRGEIERILSTAVDTASKSGSNIVLEGIQNWAVEQIKATSEMRQKAAQDNYIREAIELHGRETAFRDIIVLCQAWKKP